MHNLTLKSTPQLTLQGHKGKWSRYMGVYSLSDKTINGFPLFTKKNGVASHFLYRARIPMGGGEWEPPFASWLVTNGMKHVEKNHGYLRSRPRYQDLLLPTHDEIEWEYEDGEETWTSDLALTATKVRHIPLAPPTHTDVTAVHSCRGRL